MVLVRLASEALVATTETLPIVENDTLVTFSAVGTADSEENTIAKSTLRNVDTSTGKSTMPLEVVSADLITVEFDALRFDAAASLQILQRHNTLIPRDSKLISSPYNDPDHLLDLRTLDTQNRLVAQALTFMKPVGGDYATADYGISFNWEEVLSNLQILVKAEGHQWTEQSFYTVIFRSQLNPDIDLQRLHDLDKTSHREATVSGGLLKYWFGKKDSWERNLATCLSSCVLLPHKSYD